MASWKTGEILDGDQGIVELTAASNTELAVTADILTDALSAMGDGAGEASHYANVMAKTCSNANTNVVLMGESLKESATIAGAMDASIEDLSIGIGLMANAGIKGSQAGNQFKNSIRNVLKP